MNTVITCSSRISPVWMGLSYRFASGVSSGRLKYPFQTGGFRQIQNRGTACQRGTGSMGSSSLRKGLEVGESVRIWGEVRGQCGWRMSEKQHERR